MLTRADRVMQNTSPTPDPAHKARRAHRRATHEKRAARREKQGTGIGARPRLCGWVAKWVQDHKLDKPLGGLARSGMPY